MRLVFAAAVLLALVGGCATMDLPARGDRPDPMPGERMWTDDDGVVVSRDIIIDFAGAERCAWESIRVISIGDPFGQPIEDFWANRYMWDPMHVLDQHFAAQTSPTSSLVASATDTGFRSGDNELWLDSADSTILYIVTGATYDQYELADRKTALCD